MRRACERARIPLVFVHVPPMTLDAFPALTAYMAKAGAAFVDVLPVFEERMRKGSATLYLEGNMHLNEAGHRIVAEQVAAYVRAHPELLRRGPGEGGAGSR
jgi:hypothetical protein